jgi:hypothetical protein
MRASGPAMVSVGDRSLAIRPDHNAVDRASGGGHSGSCENSLLVIEPAGAGQLGSK